MQTNGCIAEAKTQNPLVAIPCGFKSHFRHHVGAKSALLRRLFVPMAKRRHPPAPLLLLSKSNPLRWASIWYWVQIRKSRHLYCCDVPCSSQAAYRLRRLFHFIAKLIARSFCCFSSPNRNRLRRIAIWFWGAELKAKTSMPMRFPTSGQSLFCSGSGGRDSGLLRRADAVLAKRAGAKRMQAQRR